jgi:protein SCO1/2
VNLRKTKKLLIFCIFVCLVAVICYSNAGAENTIKKIQTNETPPPVVFHEAHKHHSEVSEETANAEIEKQVGVDEHLGQIINLDVVFSDEHNNRIKLLDFVKKPTLILPVFYSCPQACSIMLASLASAIKEVPLAPGEEYQVIAASFDVEDTPDVARHAKANYVNMLGKDFPGEQWKFLTSTQENIDMFLNDLGYRLKRLGSHAFIHPNALIVISPDGKIIRYLYGLDFLPFDIGMALTEADKGTPHLSIRRMLTYCFDYDSKSKTYIFKSFRVSAVVIMLALAGFLFFLLRKKNTRQIKDKKYPEGKQQ